MAGVGETVWFEFVESKTFSKRVRELPGEVLANIQSDLVQNPERGALMKGTHGVRKARVADPAFVAWEERQFIDIDIFIFTWNTPAEFTCSTCSAKVSRSNCRPSRSRSSER